MKGSLQCERRRIGKPVTARVYYTQSFQWTAHHAAAQHLAFFTSKLETLDLGSMSHLNTLIAVAIALLATATTTAVASAHCQVPCGIYGDQLRFQQLLEDEQTISKAQITINELSAGPLDAQGHNQMSRWVTTKEEHAQRIQDTISAYFLAQRIKPDADNYGKTLMAAHMVIIDAMKCKQSADPATAKALETSILDLYRAYEGKEPTFEHSH